jgi:hypothetical protein
MVAVPDGLQEGIGESEENHPLHGPLHEVMVDSKNGLLLDGPKQDPVEVERRGKVTNSPVAPKKTNASEC